MIVPTTPGLPSITPQGQLSPQPSRTDLLMAAADASRYDDDDSKKKSRKRG